VVFISSPQGRLRHKGNDVEAQDASKIHLQGLGKDQRHANLGPHCHGTATVQPPVAPTSAPIIQLVNQSINQFSINDTNFFCLSILLRHHTCADLV